jgi:carbonic anhydrase/acetyltransferase-like protein (isoleucine patch superfamily)
MTIRSYQGTTPQLGERAFIDPTALVLGDVVMGDDVSVWPMTVIRADMNHISIGSRCSIQDGSVLHITHSSDFNPGGYPLIIGDDVTIGHQAMLHGCTLGNRILIGMGAMVMDGAIVEDEVVLGAGSLVAPGKVLESGFMYMGRPAKKIRAISDKERRFFTYTAGNYVRLKDKYLAEGY